MPISLATKTGPLVNKGHYRRNRPVGIKLSVRPVLVLDYKRFAAIKKERVYPHEQPDRRQSCTPKHCDFENGVWRSPSAFEPQTYCRLPSGTQS